MRIHFPALLTLVSFRNSCRQSWCSASCGLLRLMHCTIILLHSFVSCFPAHFPHPVSRFAICSTILVFMAVKALCHLKLRCESFCRIMLIVAVAAVQDAFVCYVIVIQ